MYGRVASDRIRQGEILSNVPEFVVNPGTEDVAVVPRLFTVVLTPDCDLERDWTARHQGIRSDLRSVTFIVGIDANDRVLIPASAWGRVKKNDQANAHSIEKCEKSDDLGDRGFPPLVFQFKNLFSVPVDLIYSKIKDGSIIRRSQLLSPYRDHLIQRFCSFFGRVALEVDHNF